MGFNHIMVDEGPDPKNAISEKVLGFNHIMVDEGPEIVSGGTGARALVSTTSWSTKDGGPRAKLWHERASFNHIMVDEGQGAAKQNT